MFWTTKRWSLSIYSLGQTKKYFCFFLAHDLKHVCTFVQMIGEESGVVLKDSGGGVGTTWAFQLGGQTMVCPIVVEDTNPPGQMLVEVKFLCIQ